ncbi:MAG TPA: aminotransferase class IV [Kineosporiaceae bacterium]|nr:aminotransferase class IV [Kineosporiaceae bacterium]
MSDERIFTSQPGGRLTEGDPVERPLLVADSWLVEDGRVRAIDKHRRRFFISCADAGGLSVDQLKVFWQEALAEIPRVGRWFPRVELCADTSAPLRLRIRPAPAPATEVRVWIADVPDPRTAPHRKGPDLAVLARLRERAAERGAQEALLTAPSGVVLEAANSSVLWWEGADLCVPSPTLATLSGVTAGLIRERAQRLGVRVVPRREPPEHLGDCEVWLVNALYGIRSVVEWPGSSLRPGAAVQAAQWRQWLAETAVPLPTFPASEAESSRQAEVPAG